MQFLNKLKRLVKPFSFAIIVLAIFVSFVLVTHIAFAQVNSLDQVAQTAELSQRSLPELIGRVINIFLGFLGVIFLVLVIYGGFIWMTASGDPTKVDKAKKLLIQATVGLVIIMSAYGITAFVINAITGSNIGNNGSGSGNGSGTSIEQFSGSLGSGIIRDHYPMRGAEDVARNAKIFVTFKESMDISSFIEGYNTNGTPLDVTDDTVTTGLDVKNIQIFETREGVKKSLASEDVGVTFTDDLKTFVFDPPLLGNETSNVQYSVILSDSIKTALGARKVNVGGYMWSFTVSTVIDLDPPSISYASPDAGGSYGRNIAVQITFDEPIDPTSSTGIYDANSVLNNFENIQVSGINSGRLSGEFSISNGYRTVVFQSSDPCGLNSCGQTIYCLAPADDISVLVKAGTPSVDSAESAIFPYDGVVDVSANVLDGNNDGVAGDDYTWSFQTTNDIVLDGPVVETISPDINAGNVALDQKVQIAFTGKMLTSTLISDNIFLTSNPEHEMWYSILSSSDVDKTTSSISHGIFLESSPAQSYNYGVEITQDVKNEYQNCFSPGEGPTVTGQSCGTTQNTPYCCNGVAQKDACKLF